MKRGHPKQMSESFLTAAFLSLSGGLQDAYTYIYRGHVFANAQTGNIVLLSQSIAERNWPQTLEYLIPLSFFAFGIAAAELLRFRYQSTTRIHWRQLVLLFEIAILFAVGFMPETCDLIANGIVSFACAMQVQTFRKMGGYSYASTMCIGNLRSGTAAFSHYLQDKKTEQLKQAAYYFGIIFLFAIGAGLGGNLTEHFGIHMIWISCVLLAISFLLMFEEGKEHELLHRNITEAKKGERKE